jgi:hypothetical protein
VSLHVAFDLEELFALFRDGEHGIAVGQSAQLDGRSVTISCLKIIPAPIAPIGRVRDHMCVRKDAAIHGYGPGHRINVLHANCHNATFAGALSALTENVEAARAANAIVVLTDGHPFSRENKISARATDQQAASGTQGSVRITADALDALGRADEAK